MPYIRSESSTPSAESGSDFGDYLSGRAQLQFQSIVDDATYAERIKDVFPDYAEKPLSEQLEPIAVVGMGCRLPGDVKSPHEFWDMMIQKGSGQMDKVPKSRFNIDAHFHENNDRPGSFAVKGGYFLHETLKEFDPNFFGVTPVEAMWMDPQQRKLLEVVYETFESAGLTLPELSGSQTAVFVASFTADFQQMGFKEPSFRHSLAATGVDPGIISNRISHVFNLKGPSIVVNTACSSSVYAMHNACNALRNNECAAAVVGGVNLVLTVDQHMNTAKLGVLSPTSTCHTFDASADGYGRAEGVGAVYLKRLSDAVRDGDPIRAVIRSSATNNNGKVAGVGITHPNLDGQEHVIRHAYRRGGDLDPRLTGLFECHGTGTAVGDPLEVHAVANAMNERRRPEDGPLIIGAVKANIGHSEAASGLSAIIKAVLAVERGIIPAVRGVTNPSPAIDWTNWQVAVTHEATPFPSKLPVRRVSVNSFGYGGTNAHVIVESADSLLTQPQTYKFRRSQRQPKPNRLKPAPRLKPTRLRGAMARNRPFLLPFSARDNATLRRNINALGSVASEYDLLDLAYTLGNKRTRFSSRGIVVASAASLKDVFSEDLSKLTFLETRSSKKPTLGFVFTGQGAQWAGMGAELMTYYPSFLQTIRHLDLALGDLEDAPDWTIEDLLLEHAETSRVNEAEFSQPLCTAIQIAIVKLLRSWNVAPKVTVGHSSGEIAAAYAAGLVSATEAIVAAYYRGKVVRDVNTGGSMLAVGLGADTVQPYLEGNEGRVIIACHNSPSGVTLSGDGDAVEELRKKLEADNIFARAVKTNGKAYHSHHMQPVSAVYENLVRQARDDSIALDPCLSTDAVMVSSLYNKVLSSDTVVDEKYWSANLLSPVLFNQAVQTLAKDQRFSDVDLFIEIGPHSAMAGPIRQIKAQHQLANLNYLPSLIRNTDSAASLLKLAGELFLRDYDVDMSRVAAIEESSPSGKLWHKSGSFIPDLPTYQWDKTKQFFAEARMSKEHRAPQYMRHDILGSLMFGGSKAEPTWRNVLRLGDLAWLKDHSLGGEAVFPAAGYFSMAMEAITQINEMSNAPLPVTGYTLRDVSIKNALVTPDDDNGIEVILNMRPSLHGRVHGNGIWWDFNVSSVDQDGLKNDHMAGTIAINSRPARPSAKPVPDFPQRASGKAWNQALRSVGFDYGPTFQDMEDIQFDGKTYAAASRTALRTTVDGVVGESRHVLHPACVDSCLQLLIVAIYAGRTSAMPCGAVPIQVDEVSIWVPTAEQLAASEAKAYSWIDKRGVRSFVGSNQLVAADGEVVMEITDMRCSLYEAAVPQRDVDPAKPRPYGEMVWKRDFDEVVSADSVDATISVAEFIELLDFKHPGQKAVDLLGRKHADDILAVTPDLDLTVPGQPDGKDDEKTQSLKEGSFQLVIFAAAGIEALKDAQNLLAPGGRAIFVTGQPVSEDIVREAGFAGIEQSFSSFFTALAPVDSQASGIQEAPQTVQVIYRDGSNPPMALYGRLKKTLEGEGYAVKASKIDDPNLTVSENVLMLADFERPLLVDISESEFWGLQKITNGAKNLFWVIAGDAMKGTHPEFNMTAGLTRALRSEQAALNIVTMDFDNSDEPAARVGLIAKKLADQIHGRIKEREYCIASGKTYISRLTFSERVNSTYCVDENNLLSKEFDPSEPLIGKVQGGKVVFQADTRVEDPLDDDVVEIQVRVSGLNKEDTLVINGTDYPTDFSHEIGGVVTRVGDGVSQFAPGDMVAGFSFDRFATFQRVPQNFVRRIRSEVEMLAVAGMPMAFGAALFGLRTQAALRPGETVLVLPGAGLAGHAAVQVARVYGGKPYVAVNNESETLKVAELYGLPREQVIPFSQLEQSRSRDSALFQFDIVFSSGWVDPAVARETWRHLTPLGRFVDCGRKNVLSRTILDTMPVNRGASYLSFDMLELHEHRPQVLAALVEDIVNLHQLGLISPLKPQISRNIAEINDAVAAFSDGYTDGKTILIHEPQTTPGDTAALQVVPSAPSLRFQSDATYLLIGCLGGLGRSLTKWMMSKGARNFTFLSRSGADSKQAAALVADMKEAGANIQVIRGDASVREDVDRAVKEVDPAHPIRGVIHAAMVLRDGLFHNMPYSNWTASTAPKVRGAMNLHAALADTPLDFFIMTSSISGLLGTPAQSNYAAANTYMDALARHRLAAGQHAASIVIPMVLGVGVVAENLELEASLKRKGMYGIDDDSLLSAFEVAILEQMATDPVLDHLVAGMDPALLAATVKEAGDDVDSFWTADPRFNAVVHAMSVSGGGAGGENADSVLGALKSGEVAGTDARALVASHMAAKLSRMLMLDPADVRVDEGSIASYGIDSMIGAELRTWIFKEFAVDVPFQQLLGASLTVNKFAELVCSRFEGL
ncbi:lovastatin nonaketide synthase [Cercophora newfieldiana]|uniref:Lovastatin nonaketide synthase n=1 Tax=Cercophora newfieldiana TaxID=92897 RepID=A0AA39Y295_9PEZI|nr:lovastatin nonaketide synthase [Cercophora newfieldiana]